MNENTTVAPAAQQRVAPVQKKKGLRDHLESPAFLEQVAKALPRHMKPERMVRVAVTAMTRTPALMDCTPESFLKCMLDLSALGLEPDGRRAHLIPFKDNRAGTTICTLIVDYKGLAELAYNSGVVSYLHADVVREGDIFNYSKGELRDHVPWFLRRDADKPEEAGQMYAAYAMARLKDGGEKVDVLSREELDEIRDNSQGYKAAIKYDKSHPWITNRQEMDKKTAFRRLSKWLPLSPEIRDRLEVEDDDETRFSSAKPVSFAPPTFLKAPEPKYLAPVVSNIAEEQPEPEQVPEEPPQPRETHAMRRAKVAAQSIVTVAAPEPAATPHDALLGYLIEKGCANWGDFESWLSTYNHIKPGSVTKLVELPENLIVSLMANGQAKLDGYVKKFGGEK